MEAVVLVESCKWRSSQTVLWDCLGAGIELLQGRLAWGCEEADNGSLNLVARTRCTYQGL